MELKDPIELHLKRVNNLDRRQFLRPMSASELLERAARVYQLTARTIIAQSAIPSLLCFIALVFGATFLLPSFFVVVGGDQLGDDLTRVAIAGLLTLFLAVPLFVFGLGQIYSNAVRESNEYILGDRLSGEPANKVLPSPNPWRFTVLLTFATAESLLPFFITSGLFIVGAILQSFTPDSLLPGFLAVLGFMMAFLTFFLTPVLLLRNSLIPVTAIVEQNLTKSSRTRGRELTKRKGHVGGIGETMFSALVTTSFIALALFISAQIFTNLILESAPVKSWLGSILLGDLFRSTLEMLPGFTVLWLITPFWAIFCTVAYYDRRIRLEGFDIRILARDVLEVRE
ncbi:hypothetical protein C0431_07615 [bacterium]|nr:hypothetical protein [bacterium]